MISNPTENANINLITSPFSDNAPSYQPDNSEVNPGNFSFNSKPRMAITTGVKENRPVNISHDRRVYRGNTYASPVISTNNQPDPVEILRRQELKRKALAKKRSEHQQRIRTPEPVAGRKHADIQTELYLEELADKLPEAEANTQTDEFLDRAPSPFFVPQKSGIDKSTEIAVGELFDFSLEVEPILEVIVGKTLEQAQFELMEEKELDLLKRLQDEHERKRNAELAEMQRMEEAEKRRSDEKARRMIEEQRNLQKAQQAAEKFAARAFSQSYLSQLLPNVFQSLQKNGYIYDDLEQQISKQFLPWLTDKVTEDYSRHVLSRNLVDDIISSSLSQPSQ